MVGAKMTTEPILWKYIVLLILLPVMLLGVAWKLARDMDDNDRDDDDDNDKKNRKGIFG